MEMSSLLDLAVNFVHSNPKLASFCMVAYSVSLASKSLRMAVEKYVADSPSKEDDKKLEEIESSKAFKVVSAVIDLLFRFKV